MGLLGALLFTTLLVPNVAYAYIDPGVTGLLYQLGFVIVGMVTAWFAGVKHFIYRFRNKKSDDDSASNGKNQTPRQEEDNKSPSSPPIKKA